MSKESYLDYLRTMSKSFNVSTDTLSNLVNSETLDLNNLDKLTSDIDNVNYINDLISKDKYTDYDLLNKEGLMANLKSKKEFNHLQSRLIEGKTEEEKSIIDTLVNQVKTTNISSNTSSIDLTSKDDIEFDSRLNYLSSNKNSKKVEDLDDMDEFFEDFLEEENTEEEESADIYDVEDDFDDGYLDEEDDLVNEEEDEFFDDVFGDSTIATEEIEEDTYEEDTDNDMYSGEDDADDPYEIEEDETDEYSVDEDEFEDDDLYTSEDEEDIYDTDEEEDEDIYNTDEDDEDMYDIDEEEDNEDIYDTDEEDIYDMGDDEETDDDLYSTDEEEDNDIYDLEDDTEEFEEKEEENETDEFDINEDDLFTEEEMEDVLAEEDDLYTADDNDFDDFDNFDFDKEEDNGKDKVNNKDFNKDTTSNNDKGNENILGVERERPSFLGGKPPTLDGNSNKQPIFGRPPEITAQNGTNRTISASGISNSETIGEKGYNLGNSNKISLPKTNKNGKKTIITGADVSLINTVVGVSDAFLNTTKKILGKASEIKKIKIDDENYRDD